MSLARALSRRTSSLLPLAPRCVRSLGTERKDSTPLSSADADDEPSTSSAPSLGWLRGPEANKPNKSLEDEWEELRDPQTGAVSWRSRMTGETTVPGAPKPDTWVEVVDKRTGLIYYWCRRTGDTTMLGEPKPGPYGRKLQIDTEEVQQLEEGRGRGKESENPSLMRLVANPLVIGVSLLAVAGIVYETMFK